jgi:hypothetical protein
MPEMSALDREHLRVVLLNTRNQVMGVRPLYIGSVNTAIIRPAEVFAEAVRGTCPAIIIVHNHPSGDPSPSAEDAATQPSQRGKTPDRKMRAAARSRATVSGSGGPTKATAHEVSSTV